MAFIENVSLIAKFIKKDFGKIISKFPKKELSKEIKVQHASKVLEDTSDVRIQNSDNKEYDDIQKTYINNEPQLLTGTTFCRPLSLEDYLKSRHLYYGKDDDKKISNKILDAFDD